MKTALAFDIGGTKIYSTVVDETGKVVAEIDKFSTPKTLDEIQDSEKRYLTMCEQRGTLLTDFVYFWKIVSTILFKRAHSY